MSCRRPTTALTTDVGIAVLRSPRDDAAVKRTLAEAGYKGEKIVAMAPTGVRELGDLTRTGAEQLRRAGMNVDLLEIDSRQRRPAAQQSRPAEQGRLQHVLHLDRSFTAECSSLRQSGHSRRRQ
jgi:peptide/nickel transport system substrate-binding protein